MKLTDDELRALYRERTARKRPDAAPCPSAEELLVGGERIADHVAICSACADEYRVLRELRPTIERAVGVEPPVPARWSAPDWRVLGVAAALVLVAGTALVVWQASRPAPPLGPVDRGERTAAVETRPANRARLATPPDTLSWTAVPAAESYRVRVYDFESTPVWESPPQTTTSVTLPAEVRDALPRGKPVYWRIVTSAGTVRSELGPFQFTVGEGGAR
jgi:hypothetical protein